MILEFSRIYELQHVSPLTYIQDYMGARMEGLYLELITVTSKNQSLYAQAPEISLKQHWTRKEWADIKQSHNT
jgi:hypothetical protein